MARGGTWTTIDELTFIDGIGGWTLEEREKNRIVLLRQYAEAIQCRKDWGKIDKKQVMQRLSEELGTDNCHPLS